ncbi:MAG: rod shape-determining protein MreC [Chloroflexota bacterium]
MLRSRPLILSLVAVVLIISLMSVTTRERERVSQVEEKVIEALAPLEAGLHVISDWIEARVQSVAELGRLRADNARLRAELERLTALETEYWDLRNENERMKSLLDFKQESPHRLVAAQVIGRNADNWFSSITINRGSDVGVAKDMPVITTAGLVGRVVKVTPHTATVMLLLDPSSGAGGMVQRSGDAGIVIGQGTDKTSPIVINLFARDADVMVGDTIITSGLGGTFPKGLLIGQVEQVSLHDYGLYRAATIKPAADFGRLQEVMVVIRAAASPEEGDGQ